MWRIRDPSYRVRDVWGRNLGRAGLAEALTWSHTGAGAVAWWGVWPTMDVTRVLSMDTERTPDELVAAFCGAVGRARDRAGEALLARYDRALEAIIRDDAAKAGVHVATAVERREVRDELRICVFEAALSYEPGKSGGDASGFDHWVRYCFQKRLAALAGGSHSVEMPESWQRVARIASRVEDRLTQQLRRAPRLEELRSGVYEHAFAWAKERVVETRPELDGVELERAVVEKLRKQGTLGAIEHLEDIVQLRGHMDSLDLSGEETLAAPSEEPRAVDGVLAMLSATERFVVEHRMGLTDGREWTFEEIADELGCTWPEVRKILTLATAKPRAPHAQYVYLYGITTQLDEVVAGDAVARLRRRVVQHH